MWWRLSRQSFFLSKPQPLFKPNNHTIPVSLYTVQHKLSRRKDSSCHATSADYSQLEKERKTYSGPHSLPSTTEIWGEKKGTTLLTRKRSTNGQKMGTSRKGPHPTPLSSFPSALIQIIVSENASRVLLKLKVGRKCFKDSSLRPPNPIAQVPKGFYTYGLAVVSLCSVH